MAVQQLWDDVGGRVSWVSSGICIKSYWFSPCVSSIRERLARWSSSESLSLVECYSGEWQNLAEFSFSLPHSIYILLENVRKTCSLLMDFYLLGPVENNIMPTGDSEGNMGYPALSSSWKLLSVICPHGLFILTFFFFFPKDWYFSHSWWDSQAPC